MKNVFYTCLFREETLSEPTDKIIYSYLVYKSLASFDCAFDHDGNFVYEEVKEQLQYQESIGFLKISNYKIAKDLSLSISTVTSSLKRIEDAGLFESDDEYFYLAYTDEIKESKYFLLCQDSGLKGDKLIYYSYLKSKSEYYGGVVPQKDYIQYREMNISRKYYQKIICELKKLGIAERLPNGKLKVN